MPQQTRDVKDQLTPIAAKLREGRSLIRPISQVMLRLRPIEERDRFAETVDTILRWINKRAGRKLPDAAWQRQSFELSDIGAQRTAAISLPSVPYWAARLDDADKTVPLRTWVTEIGVGVDVSGDILFGARLICATRGQDESFDRSIPGFVKGVSTTGSVELDGFPVTATPWVVTSSDEVERLVQLLESPGRQVDVIVFALPEGSVDPAQTAASAKVVHQQTLGAAHVCILTGPASYLLTDRVGRELSVFRQGVRSYRPQFRAWIDQPSNHPLALPHRVATWADQGPKAFETWLVNQALVSSIHSPDREERLPAFNTVRQLAAQAEREKLKNAGGSDTELLELYEQDNEQLRKDIKEQKEQYDGLLASADTERESAIQEANAAKAQALDRLYRIRALEVRLADAVSPSPTPIPETLEPFEAWCKEHLVGSVELVNRAFGGIRKSEYHDPTFIYRALLLLRDDYVPMRLEGTPERREAYEHALASLQLEDSATGDGIKYAADLYSVQYGGTRRALDRHLKGSDSRDRRYGFRLYFFWDEEGQVVVVGWLPSHLDNRAS